MNVKKFARPMPRVLSGSMLKLLAMVTMLIDHTAGYVLAEIPACTAPLFVLFNRQFSIYVFCRLIGRISFPLYCFLLVEGFRHTKSRKNYGLRLFLFALISEIPWNFAHSGKLLYGSQSVMFTLFFGYLALCAVEYFAKNPIKQSASLLLLLFVCGFGSMDYGLRGLGLILVIYFLRQTPAVEAVVGTCVLYNGWTAAVGGFAFIPINLYNGERGWMRGKFAKYACYIFYPLHLFVLGAIKYWVFSK